MDLQVALLDATTAAERTVNFELADELLNAAADLEPRWQGLLALWTLPLRQACEALFAKDGATSVTVEWRLRQLHADDALEGVEVDSLAGQVSDATRHHLLLHASGHFEVGLLFEVGRLHARIDCLNLQVLLWRLIAFELS